MVRDIQSLMDYASLEPVDVVGYSMGAIVAVVSRHVILEFVHSFSAASVVSERRPATTGHGAHCRRAGDRESGRY